MIDTNRDLKKQLKAARKYIKYLDKFNAHNQDRIKELTKTAEDLSMALRPTRDALEKAREEEIKKDKQLQFAIGRVDGIREALEIVVNKE